METATISGRVFLPILTSQRSCATNKKGKIHLKGTYSIAPFSRASPSNGPECPGGTGLKLTISNSPVFFLLFLDKIRNSNHQQSANCQKTIHLGARKYCAKSNLLQDYSISKPVPAILVPAGICLPGSQAAFRAAGRHAHSGLQGS